MTDSDDHPVITGVGLVTCLGADAASTWRSVLIGRDGFGPMDAVESPLPPGSDGGPAAALPGDYRPDLPREARYLRFAVEAALADAGCRPLPIEAGRAAVALGTTLHGIRAGGRFLRGGDPATLGDFLAGDTLRLATDGLGLAGPAVTTCSACSSSLGSLALAATLLDDGAADLVVCGGYDTVSEYVWGGFNALRLVADGPPMPFCVDRPGMKLAEGYGVLVLERAGHARRRGATALAAVAGWGESSDAHHLTRPHPGGAGAARAMRAALGRAGLGPAEVGLNVAHATGTPDNDAAEFRALSAVFGEDLQNVPTVAFKSHLGHTLGGAGAVELILAATALRDGVIPATARVRPEQVEFAGLNLATGRPTRGSPRHALCSSFGFGGANASVVVSRPDAARPRPPGEGHEVAVVGVGVVLPGAVGGRAFLELLRDGDARSNPPGPVDPAALADLIDLRRTRRMSEYVRLTLAAATLALRGCGLADDAGRLRETSAVLGTTHGSPGFCYDYYERIVAGGVRGANPALFAEGVPNAAAAQLSLGFALGGSCQTIIGTRTAGLDALRLAAARVRLGQARRVLVTAAEERHPSLDRAYEACGMQGEDGLVPSAGGVCLVLERRADAEGRGAAVLATLGPAAAFDEGPARLRRAVGRVVQAIGPAGRYAASFNGTRPDAAERSALPAGAAVSSSRGRVGELFSAGPLLDVAAIALGAFSPPLESRNGTGDAGPTAAVAVTCTDRSGPAAGAAVWPMTPDDGDDDRRDDDDPSPTPRQPDRAAGVGAAVGRG